MRRLFISDLHLSPNAPALNQAFFALLQQYQHKIDELYILGDWFEVWIGDDDTSPLIKKIIQQLKQLKKNGVTTYIQHGNRDFLMGQAFVAQFDGVLLPDEFIIQQGHYAIRLMHGDVLCTDDIKYQQFRQKSRQPQWQQKLLNLPLWLRKLLAKWARYKSKANKNNTNLDIMDAHTAAIDHALGNVDILIHGHTHRPQVHHINQKKRMVLGDWRIKNHKVIAEVVYAVDNQIDFLLFGYTIASN